LFERNVAIAEWRECRIARPPTDKEGDTPKPLFTFTGFVKEPEFFMRMKYDELQNEFNYFIENESHQEEEFKDLKLLMTDYAKQFNKVFDPTTCCNITKMIKGEKGNVFSETEGFEKLVKMGELLMHKMGEESRKI